MKKDLPPPLVQLELPLLTVTCAPEGKRASPPGERVARERPPPRLRVIEGGGERVYERLDSPDAVVRVLLEAGSELLRRRISSARAEEIERQVEEVLALFDRVDADPQAMGRLQAKLDELESLMTQTRALARAR